MHYFNYLKNNIYINIAIYLVFFAEITMFLSQWGGGLLVGRYFVFWGIAFALIQFHSKSFKNVHISLATFAAYLSYLSEFDYVISWFAKDLGAPLRSDNTIITLLLLISIIYFVVSFFWFKRKGFHRMFAMVLLVGMTSSMTFFHLLTIEGGSQAYRTYKSAQIEKILPDVDAFYDYCKLSQMTCFVGDPKNASMIANDLLHDELIPNTANEDTFKYTWLETDFDTKTMTYYFYKHKGAENVIFFAHDQNTFMILMEYFSKTFTLLSIVFVLIWTMSCFYLIHKHGPGRRKR
jgi:hypothetical protein